MEIVSREEAVARGLKWYFTGVPCKHGHVAKRNVCSWSCRECSWKGSKKEKQVLMTYAQWEAEHKRRQKEKHKQWKAKRKAGSFKPETLRIMDPDRRGIGVKHALDLDAQRLLE